DQCQRVPAIPRFAGNLDFVPPGKQVTEALADDVVIVGDNDPQFIHSFHRSELRVPVQRDFDREPRTLSRSGHDFDCSSKLPNSFSNSDESHTTIGSVGAKSDSVVFNIEFYAFCGSPQREMRILRLRVTRAVGQRLLHNAIDTRTLEIADGIKLAFEVHR